MAIGFLKERIKEHKEIIPIDFTHAIIFGETGSGKTTGIINPTVFDRMNKGHGILIFDYKGHYHSHIKHLAIQANRLNDVITIGEPWGKTINLIKNIPEKKINDFLNSIFGNHNDNEKSFWNISAANLGTSLLNVIKKLNQENYPYTIKNMLDILSSKEELLKFYETVEETINLKLNDNLYYASQLNKSFAQLKRILSKKQIDRVGENTGGINSVITSLAAPLAGLAIDIFNTFDDSNINILKELDNGKIIIIKTTILNENELNGLVFSIFSNVLERIVIKNKNISVFIDEAQKILNNSFNLPIDILRETKVDVILATQSEENIINKLGGGNHGTIKLNELLANFITKINLNGINENIPKGHFKKNNKITKLNPIYISDEEVFEAEYKYQKQLNYKFPAPLTNEKGIFLYYPDLDYDEFLFKTKSNKYFKFKFTEKDYNKMLEDLIGFKIKNANFIKIEENISDEELF